MRGQEPDEKYHGLLGSFNLELPENKCPSGNLTPVACVNPNCPGISLHCTQCQGCLGQHKDCSNKFLQPLAIQIKESANKQKSFLIELLSLQDRFIQKVKEQRQQLIQLMFFGYLNEHQKQSIKTIFKKEEGEGVKSPIMATLYPSLLAQMDREISEEDRQQILTSFQKDCEEVRLTLKNIEQKLILNFHFLALEKQQQRQLQEREQKLKEEVDRKEKRKQRMFGILHLFVFFMAILGFVGSSWIFIRFTTTNDESQR